MRSTIKEQIPFQHKAGGVFKIAKKPRFVNSRSIKRFSRLRYFSRAYRKLLAKINVDKASKSICKLFALKESLFQGESMALVAGRHSPNWRRLHR
jgi:hypothetical protein